MADQRYRYSSTGPGTTRRSPPLYNPARASMPVTSNGYTSLYGGDIHVLPNSHHEGLAPRPTGDYRPTVVPISTTTYAVRKDSIPRTTSVKESGGRHHRRPSIDTETRKPIIVTTKHASGTQSATTARPASPPRDPYRSSDEGQYYAQPASSITRARSTVRAPFSAAMDDEEYQRLKDRTEHERILPRPSEPYRPSRPAVLYSNVPHRGTLEYDDEGWEYTKPSDLARYDLDHDRPRRSRRDSIDRYHRPTVSVSTDVARPYEQNDRRPRGPPPTTWGLDRISPRPAGGLYDGAGLRMPMPPTVPLAHDVNRRSGILDPPGGHHSERRTVSQRPVSLIQDASGRPTHHDDYYRGREDDLVQREVRERGHEYFGDENVMARGFGIRVEPKEPEEHRRGEALYHSERRERRRESVEHLRRREPRRRSDEDLEIVRKRDYEDRDRRSNRDREREREREREYRDDDLPAPLEEDEPAGLGIAAASLGLGSEDNSSPRRRKDDEPDRRRGDDADDDGFEIIEHPKDRERARNDAPAETETASRDRSRHDAESKLNGEPVITASRRRPRPASAFNPNDTASLEALKAQLAEVEEREKAAEKGALAVREPSLERRPSPPESRDSDYDSANNESRGRELVLPSREEKQVRVVSPPREKDDKKPIKGILKQPKPQFPEEPNPVREGVAPHKDDKTKVDVPSGARWTKISRKFVNPEALTIGKERFEVRDDFVIVLRVLSKEEIQAYSVATAQLRERRRKEYERDKKEYEPERGEDDDEERRRRHRVHRRDRDDDPDDDRRDRDRERELREREREREKERERGDRRHHHRHVSEGGEDFEDSRANPSDYHQSHRHHRSHREHDRERDRGHDRDLGSVGDE
ncbi:hypothetical protein B0T19DRAFT_447710 [Cercophora scortea]|uniref:DUF8035 domain-containing protein n=1 Tax=Cercophora scortea TaxID=314031 RepID=A0AAE0MMV9_9PEZI|nr:hypothetical protein B0T19DRAFT_447710 [Cercophora scortea]